MASSNSKQPTQSTDMLEKKPIPELVLNEAGTDGQAYSVNVKVSQPPNHEATQQAPYSMENFKHLMHSSLVKQDLSIKNNGGFGYLSAASTRCPSRMNGEEEKDECSRNDPPCRWDSPVVNGHMASAKLVALANLTSQALHQYNSRFCHSGISREVGWSRTTWRRKFAKVGSKKILDLYTHFLNFFFISWAHSECRLTEDTTL